MRIALDANDCTEKIKEYGNSPEVVKIVLLKDLDEIKMKELFITAKQSVKEDDAKTALTSLKKALDYAKETDEFIDEYVTEAASYIEDDEVKEYFFNKCEIKFYDQDLYELMSKENEAFK